MNRYSILMDMDHCLYCGKKHVLHIHEVFNGANRKISIKYGLCVTLCPEHHNMSNDSVHLNRKKELELKEMAQRKCMEYYKMTKEEFIKIFGKSYI